MNDPRIREGLVEEMAEDYGLDAGRLGDALSKALDAYEYERDFWEWRDGEAYSHRKAIGRVATVVRRAERLWAALSPKAHEQVTFFQGGDEDDPVAPRLQFVVDLLEEYGVHYSKLRGNPGASRTGEEGDLRPLEAFVAVLVDHWSSEKGRLPGHKVTMREDKVTPEGASTPRDAKSPGLRFICEAAKCLPETYEIVNFETAVRKIKKDRRR